MQLGNNFVRNYSTKSSFFKLVNSKDNLNSPFVIVKNFFSLSPEKKDINLDLIIQILGNSLTNFDLKLKEFNSLIGIKPERFDLLSDMIKLKEYLSKDKKEDLNKSGVYVFINKINGKKYVGSSISLYNRLTTGYFIPELGKRKIDLAIMAEGLNNFYLDIYLIPKNMIVNKITGKNLVLSLEQIYILKFNPEYNNLIVAGSPVGLKRSLESMLPSFLKNLKPIFLHDEVNKELIYVSKSHADLSKDSGISRSNISIYKKNNTLYLNRFIFSDTLLSGYVENIMDTNELLELISDVKILRKKDIMKQVDSKREETWKNSSKKIELTNVLTNEVLIFESMGEAARYVREYDSSFKCSVGTLSDSLKKGSIYKKTFKFINLSIS